MTAHYLSGLLENIFVNAPIGIISTDLSRQITSANQLAIRLHGFNIKEELVGIIFPDFIPNPAPVIQSMGNVFNGSVGKSVIEYQLNNKTIRLVSSLLRDEYYTPIGMLNMCEDITEEKLLSNKVKQYTINLENMVHAKTEELKSTNLKLINSEKLRLLGNIVASVAHEMGNPLCSLEYLLSDIKESTLESETQKSISLCLGEIDRMGRLLQRLRELYRPSTGRKVLININHLLEDTLKINRSSLANKNIELETHLDPEVPAVFIFTDQIKQVFMNIIINAIDAMTNGGKLKVSTTLNSQYILVEFTDTGVGIPSENLDKLFTPFFSTKHSSNGLGLGLSVSQQIIDAHGGKLWAESKNGETTFHVHMPLNNYGENQDLIIKE